MKPTTRSKTDKTQHTSTIRVPISLSSEEDAALRKFADSEDRSKQSMAGIIYRLGLKAYVKGK